MSLRGSLGGIVLLLLAGSVLYFVYQEGYFDSSFSNNTVEEYPTEEKLQIAEEKIVTKLDNPSNSQVGNSSISILVKGKEVEYSTLFENPRWNHMPIKFYMKKESGEGLLGFDEADLEYVRTAVKVWEEETGGIVSFQEVSSLEDAELVFSWFPRLTDITGGRVVGEGGPDRVFDTRGFFTLIESGEVFLIPTANRCVGVNRPVHEIGHVLGLGHAPPGYGDIMFSNEISCKQNITQVTVEAIKKMYEIPAASDLVITDISAIKKGNLMSLNFTMSNIGVMDSKRNRVAFLVDGVSIEELESDNFLLFPNIIPGFGLTNNIVNVTIPRNASEIRIVIDSENVVKELSESNNEASARFSYV